MFYKNVSILAVDYVLPETIVTSSEIEAQLAPILDRFNIKPGMIEGLTGIRERRFWDPGVQSSDIATMAAEKVIEKAGISRDRIGCMISTSVCKDYIEPSVASLVHGNLGLSSGCINYDVGNACLGFVNGISIVGMMIEKGAIEYGLIVDGETSREVVESTIQLLTREDATPNALKDHFATLTLGSGGVAMILGRSNRIPEGHTVNGSVTCAATQHARLCLGQKDHMTADASKVLIHGVELAFKTWSEASETLDNWSNASISLYVPHQVSQRNMDVLHQKLGLPLEKFHLNFYTLGNIGPAALPITLAQADEQGRIQAGDHVALMGIGSGLNCSMMSVTW